MCEYFLVKILLKLLMNLSLRLGKQQKEPVFRNELPCNMSSVMKSEILYTVFNFIDFPYVGRVKT